jgi:CTP synthase (UTP-ammonia lyase)
VLGIHDADHEESASSGSNFFISKLSCSLVGQTHIVKVLPSSRVHQIYGKTETAEPFFCNYGLNQNYRHTLEQREMKIVGVDEAGEVRIIELPDHRLFIATLFVPQLSSRPEKPHELIMAYLQAAREFRAARVK